MSNEPSDNEYKFGLDNYQPGVPDQTPGSSPETIPATVKSQASDRKTEAMDGTAATVDGTAAPPTPPKHQEGSRYDTSASWTPSSPTTGSGKSENRNKQASDPSSKRNAGGPREAVPHAALVHVSMLCVLALSLLIGQRTYVHLTQDQMHVMTIARASCSFYQKKVDDDNSPAYERSQHLYARHCNNLGDCYLVLHEFTPAQKWLEESFAIKMKQEHTAQGSEETALRHLASVYFRTGDYVRAELLLRKLLEKDKQADQSRKTKGDRRLLSHLVSYYEDLVTIMLATERIDEAERLTAEGKQLIADAPINKIPILRADFEIALEKRDFKRASAAIDDLKAHFRNEIGDEVLNEDSGGTLQFHDMEARLAAAQGNFQQATELQSKCLKKAARLYDTDSPAYADGMLKASKIYFDAGQFQEAEKLLEKCLPILGRVQPCRPALVKGWTRYKGALERNHKDDLAREAAQKVDEMTKCRAERDRVDREKAAELSASLDKVFAKYVPPNKDERAADQEGKLDRSDETDAGDRAPYLIPALFIGLIWAVLSWKLWGNIAAYIAYLKGRSEHTFFPIGLLTGPAGWLVLALMPSASRRSLTGKQMIAHACAGWVIALTYVDLFVVVAIISLGGVPMKHALPIILAIPAAISMASLVLTIFSASLLSAAAILIGMALSVVLPLVVPCMCLNEAGLKKIDNQPFLPEPALKALNTAIWRYTAFIALAILVIMTIIETFEF